MWCWFLPWFLLHFPFTKQWSYSPPLACGSQLSMMTSALHPTTFCDFHCALHEIIVVIYMICILLTRSRSLCLTWGHSAWFHRFDSYIPFFNIMAADFRPSRLKRWSAFWRARTSTRPSRTRFTKSPPASQLLARRWAGNPCCGSRYWFRNNKWMYVG